MATSGLSDGVVVETDWYCYVGQVRTGTESPHGHGTYTCKMSSNKYEGEWKDSRMSGQGLYTWSDGRRYRGGWKDSERSGRGLMWLPRGRVFDGAWAADYPLQGTFMEHDGTLFRATFDGETGILDWGEKELVLVGRIASGRLPPPGRSGGPPPVWDGLAKLEDGTSVGGMFRGLRPYGRATVTELGGEPYMAEYDGERTIAEDPVPIRMQASHSAFMRFLRARSN
jgi:hypothetical protein